MKKMIAFAVLALLTKSASADIGTSWYVEGPGMPMQFCAQTSMLTWRNADGWAEPIGSMICHTRIAKVVQPIKFVKPLPFSIGDTNIGMLCKMPKFDNLPFVVTQFESDVSNLTYDRFECVPYHHPEIKPYLTKKK